MWPLGLPLVVLTAAQSSLEEASVSLRYWFARLSCAKLSACRITDVTSLDNVCQTYSESQRLQEMINNAVRVNVNSDGRRRNTQSQSHRHEVLEASVDDLDDKKCH